MNPKNIIIAILTAIITILGGTSYQQSNNLNEVQKQVVDLSRVVTSMNHSGSNNSESE